MARSMDKPRERSSALAPNPAAISFMAASSMRVAMMHLMPTTMSPITTAGKIQAAPQRLWLQHQRSGPEGQAIPLVEPGMEQRNPGLFLCGLRADHSRIARRLQRL